MRAARFRFALTSTTARAFVAAFALPIAACAARAPSLPANHPADPAAPTGRLAGPPAILRVALPAPAAPTTAEPPESEPAPTPEHDHAH